MNRKQPPGPFHPLAVLALALVGSTDANASAPTSSRATAAIAACRAGMAKGDALSSAEWTSAFAASCGGLFAEPACQRAWGGISGQPPWAKMTSIIEACRAAYCPTLPDPRPEICVIVGPVPLEQHQLWPPFQTLVLSRDLGLPQAEVTALIADLPRPASAWENHASYRDCGAAIDSWPASPAPRCDALRMCANEAVLTPTQRARLGEMIRAASGCVAP